jgi:hypothetical protein
LVAKQSLATLESKVDKLCLPTKGLQTLVVNH